jgi:hypothetical protein
VPHKAGEDRPNGEIRPNKRLKRFQRARKAATRQQKLYKISPKTSSGSYLDKIGEFFKALLDNNPSIAIPDLYEISVIAKLQGNVSITINIEENLLGWSTINNNNATKHSMRYVTTNRFSFIFFMLDPIGDLALLTTFPSIIEVFTAAPRHCDVVNICSPNTRGTLKKGQATLPVPILVVSLSA